ncbi:hypothetical protein [Dyadobacter psychrotolerans]|uniref:hypothetical protein n=1 Tax=Dyadobacter psychrotolerans TaxID=2541721 RepID=UPI0015F2D084|nr:hypothetical protein [Dyadobacter psychrotolerans]
MKVSQTLIKYTTKIGKYLFIGLFALITAFLILYPELFNCEIIRSSEFREVKQGIFVSPDITASQSSKILKTVRRSEARVDSFYAGKKSRPVIIICSNPQQYEKYCNSSEGAGCSLGTPWGSSFIILNAEGMNVDVISHEMSHIELLARLGWFKTVTEVPQWFNEGVALMLDRRFVENTDVIGKYFGYMDEWLYYTRGGQEILELENITSVKEFFNGNQQYVMLAYMTSGLEVSYWLAETENTGIQKFIKLMDSGKSFAESYNTAEKMPRTKRRPRLPRNPLRLPSRENVRD